jgi:hypothetical protein
MINLKTFCLSFLLAGLFINCSSAQNKPVTVPMTPIDQPSSATFNTKTQRFESTGGNFTLNIPQAPLQTRDLGTETANKKGIDVGKMFIWQFEKTTYTILYKKPLDSDGNPLTPDGEDPKTQNLRDLEALNIGMRRGIVLRRNEKLLSEKSISFNNYPGTEFRYISPDGVKFIGRVYSINSIGYQIVGGYVNEKDEKEVLEILDSFKLMTETNQIKGK